MHSILDRIDILHEKMGVLIEALEEGEEPANAEELLLLVESLRGDIERDLLALREDDAPDSLPESTEEFFDNCDELLEGALADAVQSVALLEEIVVYVLENPDELLEDEELDWVCDLFDKSEGLAKRSGEGFTVLQEEVDAVKEELELVPVDSNIDGYNEEFGRFEDSEV